MRRAIVVVGITSLILLAVPVSSQASVRQAPVKAHVACGYRCAYYAWAARGVKFAWHYGHLYASWECTLVGTVVGAGVTFVGAGTPPAAIFGILAGGAFTAGCELGYPNQPGYMVGVPISTNCIRIYPYGRWGRREIECVV